MKANIVRKGIIGIFCSLYILVSLISTVHVIDFFEIANPRWMAITLAVAFEIGAAASLASLVILDKMNRTLVWTLFITITLMQMQGNLYHAFIHMGDFTQWSQLFDLVDEDPLFQKRILAGVAAGILPLVALGFIKSLVDYIKPGETEELKEDLDDILEEEDYDSSEEEEAWQDELDEIEKEEERFKDIEWDEEDEEDETEYLLKSEKNKEHLEESIKQAKEMFEEDEEDDGPPWYENEEERMEDLLNKAAEKKAREKRDSFLDNNLEDDKQD